jgi:6-phosphogluconate dehydrogenase
MAENKYDFGMIGLGVMGRNLLLNMADHGFSIAGLDTDATKVTALRTEGAGKEVDGTTDMKIFISMLKVPRKMMMLVPAGKPVDDVLKSALPFLQPGDVVIDGGNSHFTDTDRRIIEIADTGIQFMGVGVSGGEEGARRGPSIMPGGSEDAYKKVQAILEAVSAKVNGEPCVTHIGPGSAGHYTKMVHNGIEYGIMQLISESYDIMKRGLLMTNDEIGKVYADWNEDELKSYLIEITAKIFTVKDDLTKDGLLVDHILDSASQKGTGMWTSESALDLQVPTPVIDLAVTMRDLTALKKQRDDASRKLPFSRVQSVENKTEVLGALKQAVYFSMITIYAQGMHLLKVASDDMKYEINLDAVAKIWRGGCIIRSGLLEPIAEAYSMQNDLVNLMMDNVLGFELLKNRIEIQKTISFALQQQIPVAALSGSLAYFDGYRSAWLPANLIQAQRDFFGSHTYKRNDKDGTFHTNWE